ncbi:ATP-binding protein [Arthrobacter cryoconiti]|uniref:histidine kinase n=1 Tax=Arthrobacter cryoconiti TaxID=748907 RepID=A0ABV8R0T1_9MICC|nr:sensor histidine kinase [Arthrobacter cryoconiti]MCC9067589.1 sensor histidine kinase [Arthrobacter cryoconiti]
MTLKTQLLLLQIVIVLITVVGTGAVASFLQEQQLRNNYQDRMIGVAESVATMPVIVDAFYEKDPSSTIQPIAALISKSTGMAYAVVMNNDGIRYSHPDPAKIGLKVSTDPDGVLSGETYVGTQTGTLGRSWRVKVPIFNAGHSVIGAVSVGVLESDLRQEYLANSVWLFLTIGIAAIFGVVGAAWVTVVIRKRIFGLEPEEIAGLLEEREAILHGVREGLVAVDDRGCIALINDAALSLLGLNDGASLVGTKAVDSLDDELARLLDSGDAEQSLVLSGERVLLVRRDIAKINGRPAGTILILRDNTELHTLLRDLDGVQGLADGLRAQAHGFANKLHVISGLLELGRVEQAVSFISHERSAGTLSAMTGGSGISEIEVAALLLMKQLRAEELGIKVSIESASTLPTLSADPCADILREDLLTIIGNLLDNAAEATGAGGQIYVSIQEQKLEGGDSNLVIVVADSGDGIPAELQERVFTPGFSSKVARPGAVATGRGIGLTLVRRITTRRDGRVEIKNGNLGESILLGAWITVVLPLERKNIAPIQGSGMVAAL